MCKIIAAVTVVWLTLAGGVATAADHTDPVEHLTPREQWCAERGIPESNDDGTTSDACLRVYSQCKDDLVSAELNWAYRIDQDGKTRIELYHDGKTWIPCPQPPPSGDGS